MNQPHEIDPLIAAWEDRRKETLQRYKACADAAYKEVLSCEAVTIDLLLDDIKEWRNKQVASHQSPP